MANGQLISNVIYRIICKEKSKPVKRVTEREANIKVLQLYTNKKGNYFFRNSFSDSKIAGIIESLTCQTVNKKKGLPKINIEGKKGEIREKNERKIKQRKIKKEKRKKEQINKSKNKGEMLKKKKNEK